MIGEIGRTVADAIRVRREQLGVGYTKLSRDLTVLGRDIPPLGLRKIETGERRVDVDDLVYIAYALGVTPITLLLPPGAEPNDEAPSPAADRVIAAKDYWAWLCAGQPLTGSTLAFWGAALPGWERYELEKKFT